MRMRLTVASKVTAVLKVIYVMEARVVAIPTKALLISTGRSCTL